MSTCPYGFRIVGATVEERRLVDAGAALAGYAACDERAQVTGEAYLSSFQYSEDFRQLLQSTGSTRGFGGICWAPWLWFDIDRPDDLDAALLAARRLASALLERYPSLGDDDLLSFFSGSKGFHVGLPTCLWGPDPSEAFNRVARRFAESIAERIGVTIDAGVYDKVRAFRAPNSRHPKTGRHKRRLSHAELMGLSLTAILRLAEGPECFEVPTPTARCEQAAADWRDAERSVAEQTEARAQRRAAGDRKPTLNALTLDFIRDSASEGDRHRLLFSAAANLAEFGCPSVLAHALLTPAALDSGLPPRDVHRQIECGLAHVGNGHRISPEGVAPGSPPNITSEQSTLPAPNGDQLKAQLASLWNHQTADVRIPEELAEVAAEREAIRWESSLTGELAQRVAEQAIAEFEQVNRLPPSRPLFSDLWQTDAYREGL